VEGRSRFPERRDLQNGELKGGFFFHTGGGPLLRFEKGDKLGKGREVSFPVVGENKDAF